MKSRAIYLSIICILGIASPAFAQEKKEEIPFKCPCNCSCIEVATDGFLPKQVLNSVPFDEPFMLYWKKGEGDFISGVLSIEHPRFKATKSTVSAHGDYVIAKVSDFLRPNKNYELKLKVSFGISLETKKIVQEEILDLFIELDDLSISTGTAKQINLADIDNLRVKIFKKLPLSAVRLIKDGSILDVRTTYTFVGSDGDLFQPLSQLNGLLKVDNPELVSEIRQKLSGSFSSVYIIEEIKRRHGVELQKIVQKINTDDVFAKKILSGQISVKSEEELADIDIRKIDKDLLKKYMGNLDNLVSVLDNLRAYISIDSQVKTKLQKIASNYSAIINKIDAINKELEGTTKGSLVDRLFESFNLKIDSNIADLETSTRTYVGADMGALIANLNNTPDSYRILPYVGLNLYFSAVNKKAPLNHIIETYKFGALLKIVSLHAGVTIPTMSSRDYQGIFNVENPKGFIVGLGIRPYRAVKFNFGWLLQNRASGNGLNSSFHVASRNYFSVSLDMDVKSIIPDVKNLFAK